MKKRLGMWKYLLSVILTLALFATNALAVDVSGTVNYSGTKGGRIFVTAHTSNGEFGTSTMSTGFTIRGLPSGPYTLSAFMDTAGVGERVANSPFGAVDPLSTGSTTITLVDPTPVIPGKPLMVNAFPGYSSISGDSSVLLGWKGETDMNGLETADGYYVYWDTSPSVGQGNSLGGKQVKAGLDSPVVIGGLSNNTGYYFVVVPYSYVDGTVTYGTPSDVFGPLTISAPTGGNTVSGTVIQTGVKPTGPLYVAVVKEQNQGMGIVFYTKIPSSSITSTTNFSISGIPDGTYSVFAVFDNDNDGIFAYGDVSTHHLSAPIVNLSSGSGATGVVVNLAGQNADAAITTSHGKDPANSSEWFNIEGRVRGQLRVPVNVALIAAPPNSGFVVPMDLAKHGSEFVFWERNDPQQVPSPPTVGDSYTFRVTYSNATEEDIIKTVTGVLDSFPVNPAISESPVTITPTFTWKAPAVNTNPPSAYVYGIWVADQNGGYDLWNSSMMPSSQLSVPYGFGGNASPLQVGGQYEWNLSVRDVYGNEAYLKNHFSPSVDTGSSAPQPSPGDASGTYSYDSVNGVLTINWSVANFVCDGPQVGIETIPVASLSASTMAWSGSPGLQWSRISGETSGVVGTWIASNPKNNVYEITFNANGTVAISAVTYCGGTSTPPPPSAYTFTGRVQDCTQANCVDLQGVTITTVGLTPELTTTSDVNGLFTLNVPVTSTLNSLPATAPFHFIMSSSLPSLVNSASSKIQLTANSNVSDRPYSLYPATRLTTSWGNSAGNGVIRSRVVDSAIPATGYIAGAVVTATTSTSQQLTVEYVDTTGAISPSATSTFSNGMYMVRNIPAGAIVNVTASAPGYTNFQPRSFNIYADTVSQGRIGGTATSVYTFTGGVQDCSSTCSNLPGVTVTTVGLSPNLTTTSDASGLFTFNIPATSTVNSQPATAPFHLVFSKAGFNNSASSQMQFTSSMNVSDRPYALFTSANLSSWGNTPGTGVIRSRIVDVADPVAGYIAGATVTASTPAGPLPVEYFSNGNPSSTGPTDATGMYIIKDIPAGAFVTVNASAPNYTNFQTKQFNVYADTVSQGRITGVSTGTASDITPPSVPANVTATAQNALQVNVNWSSSTDNVGVAYYQVYRDGNLTPIGQPAGETNTFWHDTTVSPMTSYSYTVAACDLVNNCSAHSNPVSVTTPPGGGGTPSGPVTLSGTISYNGTKTGHVYVSVQTNNGTLGTAIKWTAGMTSATYSIRGVPSYNAGNIITAYLDFLDTGTRSATSPEGSSSGNTSSGRDITLSTPAEVAPSAPQYVEVRAGNSAVLLAWQPNKSTNGIDADSYDVYWNTTDQVSSTNYIGRRLGVPAGLDSPLIISSLTNGTAYYFQVVPRAGSLTGAASAVAGPVTPAVASGLNTITGTVTYNGTIPAGTPLLVAAATGSDKGIGTVYFKSIANAAASTPFSIAGIPDGSYEVYVILDLNNDGIIGIGDVSNTRSDLAPVVVLSGGAGAAMGTVALQNKNAVVSITTDHSKHGTNEWYNLNGSVSGQLKRPVAVTLKTAPTTSTIFSMPMDLTIGNGDGKDIQFWGGNNSTLAVGDTYTFDITYSDGTKDVDVTAAVTGVISNFPVNPTVSSPVSTVPTFSWSAPSPAPTGNYQYSLWIRDNYNNNNVWEQWSIPSNVRSVTYGSGSSSNPPLQIGTTYNWHVSVRDQNGNRATIESSFTPTVSGAAADTTAPAIVSTVPVNNATGVSINAPISITFTEAVTGLPELTAALKNNATNQYVLGTGTSTADGKTHTFMPSVPLTPGTTYSIQLSTVTDMVGNPLPATTLTFTTAAAPVSDTTPPAIVSTIPGNNATGVPFTTQIAITFSEPVKGMPDPATAVKNNKTGLYVVGVPSESTDGKTMIFTPSAPLDPNTTYSIQLSTVTDIAGNKLPATTLSFTTAAGVNLTTIATPPGGPYTSAQSVVLTSSVAGSTIYYTTDGTTPTTSSTSYTTPIAISATTTLKFFSSNREVAADEPVKSLLYSIDSTPPVTTASLASGSFTSAQSVTLTANEKATIFFTLNGATPTVTSPIYSRPIVISSTATLKFFARDSAGNLENVQQILYTIDSTPPKVTPVPEGGAFTSAQNVTLSTDEAATIYYTLDGTEPSTTSPVYSAAIPISSTTTLKFFAKDTAGNVGITHSVVYTIDTTAPVLESTIPATTANVATGVSIGTKFSVTFSEAVTGLPEVTAVLKDMTTGQFVTGTGMSSPDNKIHTFIPDAQLTPGRTYTILFTTVTDMAGNALPPTTLTFTTVAAVAKDDIPPLSVASIETGTVFSSVQSIVLKANEAAKIYYTTDGTTPTTSSTLYSAPIAISATTNLKFFAVDTAGNSEVDKNSVWYYVVPGGDINQDGKVDVVDALKMLEIAVGRVDATSANRKNADVAPLVNGMPNPDGKIDIGDVVVILRRIVGSVTW